MLRMPSSRIWAFGAHFFISVALGILLSVLVFLVWYPGALSRLMGVPRIFLMLVGIDVLIGPCLTLLVYDLGKPELKRDLLIIAVLQVLALTWGVRAVAEARPVYLVFNAQRFDVVLANQLSPENVAKGRPEWQKIPWFGPRIIGARRPQDPAENDKLLRQALGGGDDIQMLPQYYVGLDQLQNDVLRAARSIAELHTHNSNEKILAETPGRRDVRFIPLSGPGGDGVVWVDTVAGSYVGTGLLNPW
jgi:hypothetical protein